MEYVLLPCSLLSLPWLSLSPSFLRLPPSCPFHSKEPWGDWSAMLRRSPKPASGTMVLQSAMAPFSCHAGKRQASMQLWRVAPSHHFPHAPASITAGERWSINKHHSRGGGGIQHRQASGNGEACQWAWMFLPH